MDTISLTPQRVEEIFSACMFKEGEDLTNYVRGEGITVTVGFHPERLVSHKQEIEALLDELPDEFKQSGGGGMSFLNACLDKHGNQWTGMHRTMEQLFQLGIAVDKAAYLAPRELWGVFPGGMPYIVVKS